MSIPTYPAAKHISLTLDSGGDAIAEATITCHSGIVFLNHVTFYPENPPGSSTAYKIEIRGPDNDPNPPHLVYESGWIPVADNLSYVFDPPRIVGMNPASAGGTTYRFYAYLLWDAGTDGDGVLGLSYIVGRGESHAL